MKLTESQINCLIEEELINTVKEGKEPWYLRLLSKGAQEDWDEATSREPGSVGGESERHKEKRQPGSKQIDPKMKAIIKRVARKIDAVPGLDNLLKDIEGRIPLEQFLLNMIKKVGTDQKTTSQALAKTHRTVLAVKNKGK